MVVNNASPLLALFNKLYNILKAHYFLSKSALHKKKVRHQIG